MIRRRSCGWCRECCRARIRGSGEVEPELRGDLHPIPNGCECCADEFFIGEGLIDLGGVEERDGEVDSAASTAVASCWEKAWPWPWIEAHEAEAEGRDFKTVSEGACLHRLVLLVSSPLLRGVGGYARLGGW